MDLLRVGHFLELLESELAGQPDLLADLKAVLQFEPQALLPWLGILDLAEQRLGDLPTVVQWLTCPHIALNGAAPAALVGEPDAIEIVRCLLQEYPLPPWRETPVAIE